MSVQVRRRREAAAFLSTFVGAQGELLVDTTNNRVQVHDGATPGGWPAAKLADVIGRTPVADANYSALATDRTIAYTALTSARTVTLPPASAYPTGTQLLVVDESGACSLSNTITLARSGTDTINGATTAIINAAYGFLALMSSGAGRWTSVDFTGATTAQLTNRNAVINGNFTVNQRAYASGTALAAGVYAHDRWKAGSAGCTYTFAQATPDTAVAITAGSLVQVVEGVNVPATSMWLTWTGTATARVYQGTAPSQTNPAYAAGTPANISGTALNAMLVGGLTVGTNISIEFTGGTLGLVQFEAPLPNAGPTRFERRLNELALCRNYFRFAEPGIGTWYVGGSSAQAQLQFNYGDMRPSTAPTISLVTNYIFITDPGVANVVFSAASMSPNAIGPASATINFGIGGGTQSGSPVQYHVALLGTSNCVSLSKEL